MDAAWADWRGSTAWTVGIEEEVMLLRPGAWGLHQGSIDVLARLPWRLRRRASVETCLGAIEYASDPFARVGDAIAQLTQVRSALDAAVREQGLAVAASGTHPFTDWRETELTPRPRYEELHRQLGDLVTREPTFAQHVHVGVPDPDDAIRLLNRLRVHLPLVLALSANSPFWQGRDTGLASTRIPVWAAFPRTGVPRAYDDYDHWVRTVGGLLRCGAFADPTFLWWDVRPQPRLGTVEVRIADVQSRPEDAAAIAALVQAVARLELEEGWTADPLADAPEALDENRFLAARDGVDAELLDLGSGCRTPVRDRLRHVVDAARPHAQDLGCADELEGVLELAADPGAARQRRLAGPEPDLPRLVEALAAGYAAAGAPA